MKKILLFAVLLTSCSVAVAQTGDDDLWGDEQWEEEQWVESAEKRIIWSGFLEGALGSRWDQDPSLQRKLTLADVRLRTEALWQGASATGSFKSDVWYDQYLQEGEVQIRDLSIAFSPLDRLDLKLGRQILTWGTGDLLFLNDLFAKDWVSFFAGREDEYLKAPSNTLRATWYGKKINVDVAITPEFTPDTFISGERFSFFLPQLGGRGAPDPPINPREPGNTLADAEWALRFFRNHNGVEYAAYLYKGFFKQPTALTATGRPAYAPMQAAGVSLRRNFAAGLFNTEAVYYLSEDDPSGDDPLVPNDQFRFLAGYEQEVFTRVRMGFQYYLEWTRDHDALLANSLNREFEPEEFRHVLTNRVTYTFSQDKWLLSLFTFYSPSDQDFYLRPTVNYRYNDAWSFAAGANLFGGQDEFTFFNQFADNANAYVRVRFSFL